MLCEKCGTENKEGTSYCKKCGEDLVNENTTAEEVVSTEVKETMEEKIAVVTEKETDRVRTSPLAVRMQEKSLKEDKKIKKKLKRGKVWAAVAIIFIVLFLAENAGIILSELGYFNLLPEEPVEETVYDEITEAETPVLGSETLAGDWGYTYSLKKNWDSDASGDYETVTEVIASKGEAGFIDKGNNHMLAVVMPGEMTVDEAALDPGSNPEAFSAWYEEGNLCIQLKGTEQKFFAAGGAELLVVKIPVSMDESGVITGGTYEHTYEKVVTEMNMKYEIKVTMEKK